MFTPMSPPMPSGIDWTRTIDLINGRRASTEEIFPDLFRTAAGPATNNSPSVDDILAERESRYGAFEDHAAISQGLKEVLHQAPKWRLLSSAQKESLEMIAHKIARILNGDPTYLDNAVDIVGYAQLMLNAMEVKDGVQS